MSSTEIEERLDMDKFSEGIVDWLVEKPWWGAMALLLFIFGGSGFALGYAVFGCGS